MDWIRKMFGYSDSRSETFKNPTWEEIFDNRNFSDKPHPPDDPFKDFHGSYSYSMGNYEDSFSSAFGQMDDMFRQLDSIMQNFHGHPGHMIITEGPDFGDTSDAQSPRDSFLKNPDTEIPEKGSPLQQIIPHHHSPFQGPIISDPEQKGGSFDGGHDDFRDFQEFGMRDSFDMMEDFFKNFGGGFRMIPFGENPGTPMMPNPGAEPGENPRDSFVKKDTDLDDRITGGFSELLKDMPTYGPPVVPGQPSISQPEGMQPQPRVQQRYHSTSIVRIRRPDGSFEETRKYTDSTGREEVTVTHSQPEDGSAPGSLLRQGDQGILDGHGPSGHFLPSLFSWFTAR